MWGGSDAINGFVDDFYGVPLKNDYDITLNRVPLKGTDDAVNQVLSEKEAGVTGDNGNIDLIWINGENFWTLKQADLLYGPFGEGLPNSQFVAWDNPAVNLDFGRPVDGMESPWSRAEFLLLFVSHLFEPSFPNLLLFLRLFNAFGIFNQLLFFLES